MRGFDKIHAPRPGSLDLTWLARRGTLRVMRTRHDRVLESRVRDTGLVLGGIVAGAALAVLSMTALVAWKLI